MKIYTKKGDKGETKLLYGDAVSKDSIAPEAYGSVDELVAALGLIRYEKELPLETKEVVLRIQRERMGLGLIPSNREYRSKFGITKKRMLNHKKEIIIMHPGPINRGVEIDSIVADSDQAIILDQVLNGVASRMAILYLFCGESPDKDTK